MQSIALTLFSLLLALAYQMTHATIGTSFATYLASTGPADTATAVVAITETATGFPAVSCATEITIGSTAIYLSDSTHAAIALTSVPIPEQTTAVFAASAGTEIATGDISVSCITDTATSAALVPTLTQTVVLTATAVSDIIDEVVTATPGPVTPAQTDIGVTSDITDTAFGATSSSPAQTAVVSIPLANTETAIGDTIIETVMTATLGPTPVQTAIVTAAPATTEAAIGATSDITDTAFGATSSSPAQSAVLSIPLANTETATGDMIIETVVTNTPGPTPAQTAIVTAAPATTEAAIGVTSDVTDTAIGAAPSSPAQTVVSSIHPANTETATGNITSSDITDLVMTVALETTPAQTPVVIATTTTEVATGDITNTAVSAALVPGLTQTSIVTAAPTSTETATGDITVSEVTDTAITAAPAQTPTITVASAIITASSTLVTIVTAASAAADAVGTAAPGSTPTQTPVVTSAIVPVPTQIPVITTVPATTETATGTPTGTPTASISTPTQAPQPQPQPPKCAFPFGREVGDDMLPRTDDGCSERQHSDCRFVPALNQTISSFYICANGVVSTKQPFHLYNPQLFPGNEKVRDQIVFAPYWVDIDIRREGYIWFGSHEKDDDDNITDKANEMVHQLSPKHYDFKAETVYIATWEDVPNYPDGSIFFTDEKSSLRNSFQAVVITDFKQTFLTYCYFDIQFSGRYRKAVVGFSAGDGKEFFNYPVSLTEDIQLVSQATNADYTGLLFFDLTPTEVPQSKADIQCRDWYCSDLEQFGTRPEWPDSLDPCPWTLSHALRDSRYIEVSTKKPTRCFIQALVDFTVIEGKWLTPETECCYQFGWLIRAPPAAGSSSPYHRFSHPTLHDELTVQPYDWCCVESNNCHLFFERRPIRSTHFYRPLFPGWINGDPHFRTLDGKTYTFNGHGEYILMKTMFEPFVLQGRTKPIGQDNTSATVLTAFAMAHFPTVNDSTSSTPSSTVLHIELTTNNTLQVYAKNTGHTAFTDITSNFTALSNISILTLDNVVVSRPAVETIQALFSSGISVSIGTKKGLLTVVFSAPEELMGETRGLLGVWDGTSDNDLTARNGTVLSTDASDSTIHNVFGLSWQVTQDESLFWYPDGLGPSNFSFPEAVPIFLDEVNLTGIASPEVITACGGNLACLFDGAVTGDEEVARQTLLTEQTNENDAAVLANRAPEVNGDDTLFAFVNKSTIYLFNVTDANDTFSVVLQGSSLPPEEEYKFSKVVDNVYNFTWTPTSTRSVSIQFLANDSSGAATLLHPLVRLCACHQELNATCTDSTGDVGENNFLLQSCTCGSGYGGTFCNVDINGCNDIDCFTGVECTDNPAPLTGATCGECPSGTITRNNSCEDVNECLNNVTNVCQQNCVNSVGSFSCSCEAGYTLNEDGKSCDDVDECEYTSLCHQICNNTVGSFVCGCVFGFGIGADGRTCEVLSSNQCTKPEKCEQLCAVGRTGSDECFCNQGFKLDENLQNCSDIDECANDNDNNCDQLCNNTEGSFLCYCQSGYKLNADGQSCDDLNECLTPQRCPALTQVCSNIPGSFLCLCPPETYFIDSTCRVLKDGETPPTTEPPFSTSSTMSSPSMVTQDISIGLVSATFANQTAAQFNIEIFKELVALAVTNFCESSADCTTTTTTRKRRNSFSVTSADVNIVSINQSNSDVVVIFFLDNPNGGIVNANDIVRALENDIAKELFKTQGLTLLEVSAVNPSTSTKDTGLTDAEKAGIIAGSIGGVILIILIICIICFVMKSKRSSKVIPVTSHTDRENVPLQPMRKPTVRHSGSTSPDYLEG